MDIQFQATAVPVCRELTRQRKTAHITMESVVPDTKDDIGRILSVRPEIYLKSKETRLRGAAVGGEAAAVLLYINEAQNAVSSLRLTQPFTLDFELPEGEEGALLQARLTPCHAAGRALNPRKVALELEFGCELSVNRMEEEVTARAAPEGLTIPLHLRREEAEAVLMTGLSEKSLTVTEQLFFPQEAARPREILARDLQLEIRDRETVGNRLLVKGEAQMQLYYLPAEGESPCTQRFTLPFSQLLDFGEAELDAAEVWVEPVSDYLDLTDSIEGQKLLDVELHALVQARGRRRQTLQLITDAYSNSMPCSCETESLSITEAVSERTFVLSAEEQTALPEEGMELLAAYPSLGSCTAAEGSLAVDLLLKNAAGALTALRRSFSLRPEAADEAADDFHFQLSWFQAEQEGNSLLIRARAEGKGLAEAQRELSSVSALTLEEENAVDSAAYPSLTAVWAETESVWELAKLYHSSPEAIRELNADLSQKPLFIPKCE